MPFIDLTGQQFGKLTVLYRDKEKESQVKSQKVYWRCLCECGRETVAPTGDLRAGKRVSCGCSRNIAPNAANLIGNRFNRLVVIGDAGSRNQKRMWNCLCDCGNEIIVSTGDLRSGHTKSCGCWKAEQSVKTGKNSAKQLTNQRFGMLVALEPTDKRSGSCVIWKCRCDCGNIHYVSAGELVNNNNNHRGTFSCGCIKSKGEQIINNILLEHNVEFERQKTFESCRNPVTNHILFFDFYLPKQHILIEYDGIQHFTSFTTSSWNTDENLIITQQRDEVKNNWCKENNIPLIRIPYTQFKNLSWEFLQTLIEEALTNENIGNRCKH